MSEAVGDSEEVLVAGDGLIRFDFRYGWCTVELGRGPEARAYRATTFVDAFRGLVAAILNLVEGDNCESVIWGGEGSGRFIDLTLNREGELAIVVHSMRDVRYLEPGRSWLPVRGEVEGHFLFDVRVFCRDLAGELRRVQVAYSDRSGYMRHWGWRFPHDLYDKLERRAIAFGYVPQEIPGQDGLDVQ